MRAEKTIPAPVNTDSISHLAQLPCLVSSSALLPGWERGVLSPKGTKKSACDVIVIKSHRSIPLRGRRWLADYSIWEDLGMVIEL